MRTPLKKNSRRRALQVVTPGRRDDSRRSGGCRNRQEGHHDSVSGVRRQVPDMALKDASVLKPPCYCKWLDAGQIMPCGELSRDTDVEPQREDFEVLFAGDVLGSDNGTAWTVVVASKAQTGHRSP